MLFLRFFFSPDLFVYLFLWNGKASGYRRFSSFPLFVSLFLCSSCNITLIISTVKRRVLIFSDNFTASRSRDFLPNMVCSPTAPRDPSHSQNMSPPHTGSSPRFPPPPGGGSSPPQAGLSADCIQNQPRCPRSGLP